MASQHRVQAYLDQHKIGGLFEELMGKVIADQPDDPILYLIKTLERKSSRHTGVRSSAEGHRDIMSVPKERSYEKPWQTQKKNRPRSSSGDRAKKPTTANKPEWDHRGNSAKTFDALWESKELDKRKTGVNQQATSPLRKSGFQSFSDDPDEHLFTSHGYRGPCHRGNEDETLNSEFRTSQIPMETAKSETKIVSKTAGKVGNDALKHKQHLEKLILSKKSAEDSGIEEDQDSQQDNAVELMEDLHELENEGVTNVKVSRGVAVRSSKHEGTSASEVRVSICARCAKVMSGEPSESAPGVGNYGQLDDYDHDVYKNNSRPQSAVRFSPDIQSDEEFESVSQVTGPRRPVWQDDSDAESVTPKKGTHMFSSSAVPTKGRPMYSPDKVSIKQVSAHVARSANFQQSTNRGQLSSHAINQTWSPELDSSTDKQEKKPVTISEVKTDALTSIQEDSDARPTGSAVASSAGGWKVHNNHDYDDNASSYYGSPGLKGRKDTSGPY